MRPCLQKLAFSTEQERDDIINGLNTIQAEIEAGQFEWRIDLEDVHMNIESRLTQRIGITGKKFHTGRSRNDQVATDIRLYVRDEIDAILELLKKLQKGILSIAARKHTYHYAGLHPLTNGTACDFWSPPVGMV